VQVKGSDVEADVRQHCDPVFRVDAE